MAADEAQAKGAAAYSAGDYTAAVTHFTEAIVLDPINHLLFSSRSAAHASLHDYSAALADAKTTVKLKPYWPGAYGLLGSAHFGLGSFDQAVYSYKKGLDFDPTDDDLKSGLFEAESAALRSRAAVWGS